MKRITFLMFMLAASVAVYAQKQAKPNVNKALTAMKEGKLAEAKEIIDAATTYEKTMNDGKTWYYRGLIYIALDTTSNAQFKSLEADPAKVALESFAKAEQMGDKEKEYSIMGPDGLMPITKPVQIEGWANHYLQRGIDKLQNEDDYAGGLKDFEKTRQIFETGLEKYSNDTLTYYVAGLAAQNIDDSDKALENLDKYFAKGGKSKDAYLIKYQIFTTGDKEDKNKALAVVQEAKTKVTDYPEFAKMEIGLLIDLNRVDEAKAGLVEAVKKEPNNKTLHFYLGYLNSQQGHLEEAKKNFQDAIKADPEYFDAHYHYANTFLIPIDKSSKEINALGNTAADSKKKQELVQRRVRESEAAIPLLEKVEAMKAPDEETAIEVLNKLSLLYYYVADDKNSARVSKKLKALGQE